MNPSFLQTAHHPRSLIADALARSAPLIVTCRHDEGWGVFKARILAVLMESNEVVLEYPDGRERSIPELTPGQVVGIAFRRGHKKCIGDTWIHARCIHTSRTGQQIPAFTIICPDELYELQRRLFYRVEIPQQHPVDVAFGPAAQDAGGAPAERVCRGRLIDISAGGLSVKVSLEADPVFEEDQELTCAFSPERGEHAIRITGRVRYRNVSEAEARYGLQFVGADATPDGRDQLDRVAAFVNTLQSRQKRARRSS